MLFGIVSVENFHIICYDVFSPFSLTVAISQKVDYIHRGSEHATVYYAGRSTLYPNCVCRSILCRNCVCVVIHYIPIVCVVVANISQCVCVVVANIFQCVCVVVVQLCVL